MIFAEETHWLDAGLDVVAGAFPEGSFFALPFNLRAALALVFVAVSCGAAGSLVVARRMAFFSDALAHTAFAGVSIGFVMFSLLPASVSAGVDFWDWALPVMIVTGAVVGYGIAAVSERTGLAGDTVIGVFFAAGIGLTALLRKVMQNRSLFAMEDFLFGDPLLVRAHEVVYLGLMALVVVVGLSVLYNPLVLSGFSGSLAQSRRVRQRLAKYAFIMLLALVVNLCVRAVGVLLINALLVVPAATAANLGRNLRQVFWLTTALCLGASLAGLLLAWEVEARTGAPLGIPGAIILVSVTMFAGSAVVKRR